MTKEPDAGARVRIAATSGELRFAFPGGIDLITTIPPPDGDPNEGGGPRSITSQGLSIWLAQGPWLTQVRFPQ